MPNYEEWDTRDAWTMIAIRQNVKNPVGLSMKTTGTAAQAWKYLEDRYMTSTDLARVYAQRDLRGCIMAKGDDFPTHIANLNVKHQ
ncbi:hypothetical protein C0991_004042, partial [Blastosporella zonata]